MSDADFQVAVVNRLSRIESLLTGDNTPERGVIVRLDRVERELDSLTKVMKEDRDSRKWFGRTVIGAAVAAIAAAIGAWVK